MRQQWRRFRRLLIVAISAVWVMCTSGILILRPGDDPEAEQWMYARMALLIMLGASSLITIWLFGRAHARSASRDARPRRCDWNRPARPGKKSASSALVDRPHPEERWNLATLRVANWDGHPD